MFRLFMVGIVLGASAAGAFLYFIPVVDQGRERSIISVQPNGGNLETFSVQVPADRVFVGRAEPGARIPADIDWPQHLNTDDAQLEIFKLRNVNDRVIGVASRVATAGSLRTTEWVLHIPARGSLYFLLGDAEAGGQKPGRLRTGTREFADMTGSVVEQYQEEGDAGRIELRTSLVSSIAPDDPVIDELAMLGDSR